MSKELSQCDDIHLYDMLRLQSEGWEQAFRELYRRYAPQVYAYCSRILDGDEQFNDVFQETFLRFYRSAQDGRAVNNVHAYLLRIARNLCFDIRKKPQHARLPELPEMPELAVEDSSLENEELARLVDMSLELLPAEQREAFILQTYQGCSYQEIGEITGVPVSTVRNRVVRARRKVREILKPYLVDYRA